MTVLLVLSVLFAIAGLAAYLAYGTKRVETTECRIGSEKLRGELKLVLLSDLHGATRFWNGSVSEIVNELDPDLVCVTGDLTNRLKQLPGVLRELDRIRCDRIYFVPGNHERKESFGFVDRKLSQTAYRSVIAQIGSGKMKVLENAGETIELNGSRLFVYGFDNSLYGCEAYNPPDDVPEDAFRIVMAHSPSIVKWLARRDIRFDLLLAGHMHGGQIRLFGRAVGPFGRYHSGLERLDGNRYFYITRGLGTVRMPFRVDCPPEIAVIRLAGTK